MNHTYSWIISVNTFEVDRKISVFVLTAVISFDLSEINFIPDIFN